jgi:hypothetical protein
VTDSQSPMHSWDRVITEASGLLGVAEFIDISFVPQRLIWLSASNGDVNRADHSHRTDHQLLVCLTGSLTNAVTTDTNEVVEYTMSVGTTIHLAR